MRLSLTRRAEYGVRALIDLAGRPPLERVTAAELASACEIPAGNVPTIVSVMTRAGILDSRPGRNGGCRLARPPEAITMLEIIECLEGSNESAVCILDARRCGVEGHECPLHEAWKDGRSAALAALSGITLEAAARRGAQLGGPPTSR